MKSVLLNELSTYFVERLEYDVAARFDRDELLRCKPGIMRKIEKPDWRLLWVPTITMIPYQLPSNGLVWNFGDLPA